MMCNPNGLHRGLCVDTLHYKQVSIRFCKYAPYNIPLIFGNKWGVPYSRPKRNSGVVSQSYDAHLRGRDEIDILHPMPLLPLHTCGRNLRSAGLSGV